MEENNKGKNPSVTLKFQNNGKKVLVQWSFFTAIKQKEDGRFLCFIPGFGIHFSAPNQDSIDQKSVAITHVFIDHFLSNRKTGIAKLALELHNRGFRTKNDLLTMQRLLNKNFKNADFQSSVTEIPESFRDASFAEHNSKIEAALA